MSIRSGARFALLILLALGSSSCTLTVEKVEVEVTAPDGDAPDPIDLGTFTQSLDLYYVEHWSLGPPSSFTEYRRACAGWMNFPPVCLITKPFTTAMAIVRYPSGSYLERTLSYVDIGTGVEFTWKEYLPANPSNDAKSSNDPCEPAGDPRMTRENLDDSMEACRYSQRHLCEDDRGERYEVMIPISDWFECPEAPGRDL